MIPTIDERLASVVRSLSEVIVPHLPDDASLAREQAQLIIGHIQIIRSQLDDAPAYELEELDDAIELARSILTQFPRDKTNCPALRDLAEALTFTKGDVRADRIAINDAIAAAIRAVSALDCPGSDARLSRTILDFEHARTQKDRKWFAPFGFDTI